MAADVTGTKLAMKSVWRINIYQAALAVSFSVSMLVLPAQAADKALLIGVSEYANSENNLPGINVDLKVMHSVARQMGYRDENILQLRDSQVTAEGVTRAVRDWLVKDVTAQDRVLLYYSGHGSQVKDLNGDESDGYDEVLSMHDLRIIDGDYTGVLLDDDFNQLLAEIPSERVAVVVDACCSGTAVRGHHVDHSAYGEGDFVIKSRGCRSAQLEPSGGLLETDSIEGMVFLAAAQDGEQSLATVRGSLFTLALQQAVLEGKNSSPLQLVAAAENTLFSSVPKKHRFHPNLIGDPELLQDKGLFVVQEGGDSTASHLAWDEWSSLVKYGEPLQVQPSREYYTDGQMLELEVQVPRAGYLNIVVVNSDDQVVVLFPNKFHPDNWFEPSMVSLPKEGFEWPAGLPYGESLIVSMVTENPMNLYKSSHQRDAQGQPKGVFLRPETADAVRLQSLAEAGDTALSTSALVLTVCASSGC